jgi:quercetin dioxygenase-like cupin family protein
MKTVAWQNIMEKISYPNGGIASTVVSKTEKMQITLFCMAAGTDISEHTSAKDGYVFVLEGRGVFRLENTNIQMLPGVLIEMKKMSVHSVCAEKNTTFLLVLG